MSMLRKIRIVEFAQGVAGPLAALRLGDLGAQVTKVETAEGDWLRDAAPTQPGSTMSAAFFELNRGKRSVVLPAAPAQSGLLLKKLLKSAAVFITDRSQDELRAIGLDDIGQDPYPANPGLIVVWLSPWGEQGPMSHRKGSELAAQAMAGYTRYLGAAGQPACRLGADVASAGTGIFACQAVLAALFARLRQQGNGQHIRLSLLNSLLSLKSIHLAAQSDPDQYAGPRVGGANYPPERGWKTADEPIFFAFGGSVGASGRPGWVQFVDEAGFDSLRDDPRFDKIGRSSTGYGTRVQELRADYEREFARYSAEELVAMIRKYAGNAAAYQTAGEAIAHPQTQSLNVVRTVDGQDGGSIKVRAFPARFSRLQPQLAGHAPQLGEHTAIVAAELGLTLDDLPC